MPRLMVWWLHVTIEAMRTLVRYWEDKHADHADYRMTHLSAGLHEASTSLREISAGHFDPTRRQARWAVRESQAPGDRYARELLQDVPVPLHVVEN